jgi:hypothetical protein
MDATSIIAKATSDWPEQELVVLVKLPDVFPRNIDHVEFLREHIPALQALKIRLHVLSVYSHAGIISPTNSSCFAQESDLAPTRIEGITNMPVIVSEQDIPFFPFPLWCFPRNILTYDMVPQVNFKLQAVQGQGIGVPSYTVSLQTRVDTDSALAYQKEISNARPTSSLDSDWII